MVERVVRGENLHLISGFEVAQLEYRLAHFYAERLGRVITADHTSIPVAGDHHRRVTQPRLEQDLRRAVEGVRVDQGDSHGSQPAGSVLIIVQQNPPQVALQGAVLNAPTAVVEVTDQFGSLQAFER